MAKRGLGGRRRGNLDVKYTGVCILDKHTSESNLHTSKPMVTYISTTFWTVWHALEKNYQMVCTLATILILCLLIPNASRKMHLNKEVNEIQRAIEKMTLEVNNAGEICSKTAEDLHRLSLNVTESLFLRKPVVTIVPHIRPQYSEVQYEEIEIPS